MSTPPDRICMEPGNEDRAAAGPEAGMDGQEGVRLITVPLEFLRSHLVANVRVEPAPTARLTIGNPAHPGLLAADFSRCRQRFLSPGQLYELPRRRPLAFF